MFHHKCMAAIWLLQSDFSDGYGVVILRQEDDSICLGTDNVRMMFPVVRSLLESIAKLQYTPIVTVTSDDLHTHRQS